MDLLDRYDELCAAAREGWPVDAMVSVEVEAYPDMADTLDMLDAYARLCRRVGVAVLA